MESCEGPKSEELIMELLTCANLGLFKAIFRNECEADGYSNLAGSHETVRNVLVVFRLIEQADVFEKGL